MWRGGLNSLEVAVETLPRSNGSINHRQTLGLPLQPRPEMFGFRTQMMVSSAKVTTMHRRQRRSKWEQLEYCSAAKTSMVVSTSCGPGAPYLSSTATVDVRFSVE